MSNLQSKQLTNSIYWAGALDPNLRVFDVIMTTKYGTTYNSYFVKGQTACAVVEGVKDGFFEEWMARLEHAGCDTAKIDYLVLDHMEPDHTGAVRKLLERSPGTKVVSSRAGSVFIKEIVNEPLDVMVVNDGDTIDLGGLTLSFISAPFLHWPDSMFTHIPEEKLLISGDVFGFHHCFDGVTEDNIREDLADEQKLYFDIIMSPFKQYVREACAKVRKLDLDVIAPSHGPVLNVSPMEAVERYERMAADEAGQSKRAFVGYVSCYGYTQRLAEAVAEKLTAEGITTRLEDVSKLGIAESAALAMESDAVVLGSPTLNRDVLQPINVLLSSLDAINTKGKIGACFGSFGWSGEATKFMAARMEQLSMKVVGKATCRLRPGIDDIAAAEELAVRISKEIL